MSIGAPHAPASPAPVPEQFSVPREAGFCHYFASGEIPQIIPDTAQNAITQDLPTRTDFNIQSYIGVPLHRPDGSVYGSICCISHQVNHSLNDRDLRSMKLFAELVIEQIDEELEDRKVADERLARVRKTLDEKAFTMVFQPIVNLSDGSLKGFEALCRFMEEPYRPPNQWFREAELVGLGVELELAAIEMALEALPGFPSDMTLTLNVSPKCLMDEALADTVFFHQPEALVLEVTEHAVVENYDDLAMHLNRYKKRGLRVAVDDAGAGYSSLRHIVQLQPDIIKLDMSPTRGLDSGPARRSLAAAWVYSADETRSTIIAEGIETEAERQTMAQLGADYGQGFLFSRPLTAEHAIAFAVDWPHGGLRKRGA